MNERDGRSERGVVPVVVAFGVTKSVVAFGVMRSLVMEEVPVVEVSEVAKVVEVAEVVAVRFELTVDVELAGVTEFVCLSSIIVAFLIVDKKINLLSIITNSS